MPLFTIEESLSLSLRREAKGFCPTGPGGGVDNSCGRGGGGSSGIAAAARVSVARAQSLVNDARVRAVPIKDKGLEKADKHLRDAAKELGKQTPDVSRAAWFVDAAARAAAPTSSPLLNESLRKLADEVDEYSAAYTQALAAEKKP